jgi:hypothetical protein
MGRTHILESQGNGHAFGGAAEVIELLSLRLPGEPRVTRDPVHALLTRPVAACWSLSFYPDAREAGGAFVPSRPYPHGCGVKGQARHPERARI